jgi:hypothetical protein
MDGEMPVTVENASNLSVPRRRAHHEVIDVDELDDEPQDQRPSRRPRHLGDSSRDLSLSDIIILDSDDGSEPGPSTRRVPGESAYLFRRYPVLIRPSQEADYARLLHQPKSSTLHLRSHV